MKTSKIFGQSLYKWFFQDLKDLKAFPNYFPTTFFQGGVGADQIFFFGKIVLLQNPSFLQGEDGADRGRGSWEDVERCQSNDTGGR